MLTCQEASERIIALQAMQKALAEAIEYASDQSNILGETKKALETAQHLRQELESGIRELWPEVEFKIITVPDAFNPYRGAFKETGLPDNHPECAERKEAVFDFQRETERQCALYRSMGLEEWADNIQNNISILNKRLWHPEEARKIINRIKQGAIPVIMPGRDIQISTWEKALKQLKPVCVDFGKKVATKDAVIGRWYQEIMTLEKFFAAIPDRPYIMWKLDSVDVTGMNYQKAKKALDDLRANNPDLIDITDIIPTEYAAAESIKTSIVYSKVSDNIRTLCSIMPSININKFLAAGEIGADVPACDFSATGRAFNFTLQSQGMGAAGSITPVARS